MQALAVVRHLLQGHSNDEHVVQALGDLLETPDEQHADLMGLAKCTGAQQESAKHRLDLTRQSMPQPSCHTLLSVSTHTIASLLV